MLGKILIVGFAILGLALYVVAQLYPPSGGTCLSMLDGKWCIKKSFVRP